MRFVLHYIRSTPSKYVYGEEEHFPGVYIPKILLPTKPPVITLTIEEGDQILTQKQLEERLLKIRSGPEAKKEGDE